MIDEYDDDEDGNDVETDEDTEPTETFKEMSPDDIKQKKRLGNYYSLPNEVGAGVMESLWMSGRLFVRLSVFSFPEQISESHGGFSSYCTHTSFRGCRCGYDL